MRCYSCRLKPNTFFQAQSEKGLTIHTTKQGFLEKVRLRVGKLLGLAREIDNGKESPSMYDVSMSSIQLQSMIIKSQIQVQIDRD